MKPDKRANKSNSIVSGDRTNSNYGSHGINESSLNSKSSLRNKKNDNSGSAVMSNDDIINSSL